VASERRIPIASDIDIVAARQKGRELASTLAFSSSDLTVIAAAISEVARNIYTYAGTGEIVLAIEDRNGRRGIRIEARDQGPGVADITLALEEGYSTSGSYGLGLPAVRRLMDVFSLDSTPGQGTVVTLLKWAR
jgi:serine/threonine-protein kinase RsbT